MSLIRWMLESVWEGVTGTVKDGANAVQRESTILAERTGDLVARESPEKKLKKLDEYKKSMSAYRERHEQRKAAMAAKRITDDDEEAEELQGWKERIRPLLDQAVNELNALAGSAVPLFWRSRIAEKTAEKDALGKLYTADTMAELRTLARQYAQTFKIEEGSDTRLGRLLNEILGVGHGLILRKD